MSERAKPVKGYVRNNGSKEVGWVCSRCKEPCYYDGRGGDGPILTCDCNAEEDAFWENERR